MTRSSSKSPSISNAFLVYCILPIVILALTNSIINNNDTVAQVLVGNVGDQNVDMHDGNRAVSDSAGALHLANIKQQQNQQHQQQQHQQKQQQQEQQQQQKQQRASQSKQDKKSPSKLPSSPSSSSTSSSLPASLPSSSSQKINKRNDKHSNSRVERDIENKALSGNGIDQLRTDYNNDKNDMYKALALADALRQKDITYHDGGTNQKEAIATYQSAIQLISIKINHNNPSSHTQNHDLNDQLFVNMHHKSIPGLLVYAYCSLAKQYFMANMFEASVHTYDKALQLSPQYLDALSSRAGSLFVLGKYTQAGNDYHRVLELDHQHIFINSYTNMARVLIAKEDAIPTGWDRLQSTFIRLIPKFEEQLHDMKRSSYSLEQLRPIQDILKTLHLAYFSYWDHKTNDHHAAWTHLAAGHAYKISTVQPYNYAHAQSNVQTTKQVFNKTFWHANIGSQTRTPIFIVGFPRSGSTLLERVLDAHPLIVGTGEDSVFNGMLDQIRDAIVKASTSESTQLLKHVVKEKANDVIRITRSRWEEIDRNILDDHNDKAGKVNPKQFVDKMLSNYMNIGFIHMLFPNALILHISRNPMDTLFSTFKHDFPPGGLDYSSEFKSLNQMYRGYRDIIDHWDTVLPHRVTHVRYEDMVNDMPGIAKAVISATGQPWDPEVLEFHKKKFAVNTYSSTQVRKAVYKDSMQSWRRYEEFLQPLFELIGPYAEHNTKTTLKGYTPPV